MFHKYKTYLVLLVGLAVPSLFGYVASSQVGAFPNGGTTPFGGGGGGASTANANTWALTQTFTVAPVAPGYNFAAGSKITELSDGVVKITNSTNAAGATWQIGGAASSPSFIGAASTVTIQRNDGGGARLAFAGAVPTAGNCSSGELFSSGGVAYECNAFNNMKPIGQGPLASSPTGGTITPAVISGGFSSFVFTVSGTPTDISFVLNTAQAGWVCNATNITANAANRAGQRVVQTVDSTTGATMQNQLVATGAAQAFTASDVVNISCAAY